MTTTEYLCRHFSRMGARLKVQAPGVRQGERVRIDVGRDRDGEFFDVRCQDGIVPEILDVRSASRHLVLMVRDGDDQNKFLLGRDERHWFAQRCLVTGVHDVRTAIASLRPTEVEGHEARSACGVAAGVTIDPLTLCWSVLSRTAVAQSVSEPRKQVHPRLFFSKLDAVQPSTARSA